LEETIRRDKCLYDQHRGRPTFQKAWEDKKKGKMEQRKKGTKPPFFKIILRDNQLPRSPE
jgi:hypothetical protein